MPVSSSDLCAFARRVTESDASDETTLRAAMSRSYYAIFHALLPHVNDLPRSSKYRSTTSNITHEDFATRLSELANGVTDSPVKELKEHAGQLVRLVDQARIERHKADYKIASECSVSQARAQLHRAERVLRLVAAISNNQANGISAA